MLQECLNNDASRRCKHLLYVRGDGLPLECAQARVRVGKPTFAPVAP